MGDIARILAAHTERYPLMGVQDAVKLLYQREFGCGHMLKDIGSAYSMLLQEYNSASRIDSPLLEGIGNGFVRVNIRAMDSHGLSIRTLYDWFVETAHDSGGSVESFESALSALCDCSSGLPFNRKSVEAFLEKYRLAGYPAMHHSAQYVAAYAPSYRVIRAELVVSAGYADNAIFLDVR